jgi:hypothetical protein
MFSKMKYLSSFLIVIVFFAGIRCGQEDRVEIDRQPPGIELFSPDRNKIFSPGDTVFINALLSDNVSVRSCAVHIHDAFLQPPADTVFSCKFRISTTPYPIDTFWIVNDSQDKSYIIYIEGLDKAENYNQILRYFHQYH